MKICVYGASSDDINPNHIESSFNLGKLIAKRNHTLVFGAGAHGVMGAVARGAAENNGYILGISPKFFDYGDILYKDCSKLIFTETMRERKQLMEDESDAFIMAPGGTGTFEEFFEILTLKQLDKHNKPIAVFNVNGYYNPMIDMLNHAVDHGFMRKACMNIFKVFDDAVKMLDYIENYDKSEVDLSNLKY